MIKKLKFAVKFIVFWSLFPFGLLGAYCMFWMGKIAGLNTFDDEK